MAETKVQKYKIDAVASLQADFEKTPSFIFADYRGLSVGQITELRVALREVGAEFHVVKNNFAKIAFSQMKYDDVANFFIGPTAMAYCKEDVGSVAKILFKLGKNMPLDVKGGLLDGNVYDMKAIEAFSKLPSRLELIQMLMGTMNAPIGNMVYALNGVTTKLVRTLVAVRDAKAQE